MNTQLMNHDVHSPIFIRAKATNDKPKAEPTKNSRSIDWRRIIELVLLLSVVAGAIYFISKLVTPQVVTVIGVFVSELKQMKNIFEFHRTKQTYTLQLCGKRGHPRS